MHCVYLNISVYTKYTHLIKQSFCSQEHKEHTWGNSEFSVAITVQEFNFDFKFQLIVVIDYSLFYFKFINKVLYLDRICTGLVSYIIGDMIPGTQFVVMKIKIGQTLL